jgi:hypothetical protein
MDRTSSRVWPSRSSDVHMDLTRRGPSLDGAAARARRIWYMRTDGSIELR